MRARIPTPVAVVVLALVALIAGFFLWKASSPGARAEQTEDLLRKAFGGGRGGVSIPPPPQAQGASQSTPTIPGGR